MERLCIVIVVITIIIVVITIMIIIIIIVVITVSDQVQPAALYAMSVHPTWFRIL